MDRAQASGGAISGGDGATNAAASAVATDTGISNRSKRDKQPKPGDVHVERGALKLRAFPITEDNLDQLGTLYRDVAILLGFAGALGGFGLDVLKDIVMASDLTGAKWGLSVGVAATCLAISLALAFGAWRKWVERGNKLNDIKRQVIWAKYE